MVILLLALLGLCLGSFVNALVWRIREQAGEGQRSKAKNQKYSILSGRSMCTECQHPLAWYDLIPVISWLTLAGKCRYCKKPINVQYPIVELITAILFVASYVFWPTSLNGPLATLNFVFWLVYITGFIALTIYDLKWMILPNRITYPLLGLAVTQLVLNAMLNNGGWIIVWQSLLGVACLGGLFYLLYQISNGKWIGGGDVKLGYLLGLMAGGPTNSVLILFLSSVIGTVVALPLLLTGKYSKTSKLPFGPFLITATVIVVLFGSHIIGWYKQLLLI